MKAALLITALLALSTTAQATNNNQNINGLGNTTCQGNCGTNVNNKTVNKTVDRSVNNSSNSTSASVSLSTSSSASKSKSKSNSSSDNNVSIGGDSIRGSAIAPSMVAMAGYSCTGASATASAGWLGGSLGLGGTKEDKECTKRETVKALQASVLSGLYTPEQAAQLRASSFAILMNMREVANPTTVVKQQVRQYSGYQGR